MKNPTISQKAKKPDNQEYGHAPVSLPLDLLGDSMTTPSRHSTITLYLLRKLGTFLPS